MTKQTKIQTVAAFIAALIALLRIFGITAFDNVTEDMIAAIATGIVMIVTWAYASHWKNNDFTEEAAKGTGLTRLLKEQAKDNYIGEDFSDEIEEIEDDTDELTDEEITQCEEQPEDAHDEEAIDE